MKIKMPIKFFGNYQVKVRTADAESLDRCQKLTIIPLGTGEEDSPSEDFRKPGTYQVIFHDMGCRRIIVGKLKENVEEKVVFQVDDKEYEFSPL
jgi:hypothetical protein